MTVGDDDNFVFGPPILREREREVKGKSVAAPLDSLGGWLKPRAAAAEALLNNPKAGADTGLLRPNDGL